MDRFEKNPVVQKLIDKVVELFGEYDRGDIVLWETLEEHTELDRDSSRFRHVIRKSRERMLEECDVAMRPIPTVGLELLTAQEQLKWCPMNRARRARRQAARGLKELEHIDTDGLSDSEKRMRVLALTHMGETRKKLAQDIKRLNRDRKTEVLPQRPIPR